MEDIINEHDKVKRNINQSIISVIVSIALILVFIILRVFVILNEAAIDKRCSGRAIATITEVNENKYLDAPFHGGRVKEKTEYYVHYRYIIEDTEYEFIARYQNENYSETISLKYNPSNLDELFYYNEMINDWLLVRSNAKYVDIFY